MSSRRRILWIVGGALIVLYCLFRIAWIVSLSFKSATDLNTGGLLPTAPSL